MTQSRATGRRAKRPRWRGDRRRRRGAASGRRSGRPPGRWDRRPHGATLNPSGERPGRGRLRGPGRSIGGQHVRARTDGPSRPSTLTGRDTRAFGWLRAAKRGRALPGRSPTVEEIILVMRQAGPGPYADRTRALIAILWRAGLRISEALALTESDLDPKTGSVLVRVGKGGKRRMVGMDDWGWEHVARWTEHRVQLPIGPLFCILAGPTRGRGWSPTAARGELRRLAAEAGARRRFAPHQLRHAHAIEMAHRRDTATDHPATARTCPPRDHVYPPPGDRYAQDRRHDPPPPAAGDLRDRRH